MNAKKFFYVCSGLFLLVAAYSVGARRADAQAGGQFAAFTSTLSYPAGYPVPLAITASGDIYTRPVALQVDCQGGVSWTPAAGGGCIEPGWVYMGNVLGGSIQVEGKTWSDVKDGYRK